MQDKKEVCENTICILKERKHEPSSSVWDTNTAFQEAIQVYQSTYCWSTVSNYNMREVAQASFP